MLRCNYRAVYRQSTTRRLLSERDLLTENFYVNNPTITNTFLSQKIKFIYFKTICSLDYNYNFELVMVFSYFYNFILYL